MDGTKYDLSSDAWTMVAFNASAALVVPPIGARIWGQVAPEDALTKAVTAVDVFIYQRRISFVGRRHGPG